MNDFNRQVRILAVIDKVFKIVTPIFCAFALLGIFAVTIWRH